MEVATQGTEVFLATGRYKKGNKWYNLLKGRKFVKHATSKDTFYMYYDTKRGVGILPHPNIGSNIALDIVTVPEGTVQSLAKRLGMDVREATTKCGIAGLLLIDQPFDNGTGLMRGSIEDYEERE